MNIPFSVMQSRRYLLKQTQIKEGIPFKNNRWMHLLYMRKTFWWKDIIVKSKASLATCIVIKSIVLQILLCLQPLRIAHIYTMNIVRLSFYIAISATLHMVAVVNWAARKWNPLVLVLILRFIPHRNVLQYSGSKILSIPFILFTPDLHTTI